MGQNELSESFWIAVSLIFVAAALTCILYLGNVASNISKSEQDVVTAGMLMTELRLFAPYNNTTISDQDIISLILQEEGSPYVVIVDSNNRVDYWCTGFNKDIAIEYLIAAGSATTNIHITATEFDVAYLNTSYFDVPPGVAGLISRRGYYTSSLIYDEGGSIVGVKCRWKAVTV